MIYTKKSITSIWLGNYKNGSLVNEENYINLKRVQEERVYPNTHGELMWNTLCTLNGATDEQKREFIKRMKK